MTSAMRSRDPGQKRSQVISIFDHNWAATSEKVPTHYENTPIQIYWKFHLQKLKIFRQKNSDIFYISAQNIDCGYQGGIFIFISTEVFMLSYV